MKSPAWPGEKRKEFPEEESFAQCWRGVEEAGGNGGLGRRQEGAWPSRKEEPALGVQKTRKCLLLKDHLGCSVITHPSPWLQSPFIPFSWERMPLIRAVTHVPLAFAVLFIAWISLHYNFLLLRLWGSLGQWLGLIYYKEPRIAQWLFCSFPSPQIFDYLLCALYCVLACLGRWYKMGMVLAIMEHAMWQESEFWTLETIFMQFSTSVTFPAVVEQKQWMLEC